MTVTAFAVSGTLPWLQHPADRGVQSAAPGIAPVRSAALVDKKVDDTTAQPVTDGVADPVATRRAAPEPTGEAEPPPALESVLDGAWRRHGCAVNPGNPPCLTIGLAADCARNADTPGCSDDRDGDGCTDVTEALSGFDPFDANDCLSNRDGAPAINCLFPAGNLSCNAAPGIEPRQSFSTGCGVALDVERALHPRNPYACATPVASPESGCAIFDRDPTCDGFARRLS